MAQSTVRPVAVVGGVRIPFCRSNTAYAELSNQDMLTAAMQGLVARYDLADQKIDEVGAGAVIKHSRDWNLARESVLGTSLSPLTPAFTVQMACGTGLQAASLLAARIASGQIESAIAGGSDTTSDAPIVFPRRFARRLVRMQAARSLGQRLAALKGFRPRELAPQAPNTGEPRTGKSMGQHCELMAKEWGVGRREQDELAVASHRKAGAAYDAGFFDQMVVPCEGVTRDNNLRPDSTLEKISQLSPAFDRSGEGTLTAANSTPLTDGASSVLLASEEWARARGLPVLGYLTHVRTAAVDFVNGEGLLMAPAVAVSEMLEQAGLTLQDFDYYEIHEAFAAQVLCTLKAWESESFCRERLGRKKALGSIDRERLNVKGGSLAFGHPFAATGARVLATMGGILDEAGGGRGLISVCTAGGMGVTAIMERP